jgi:MoaD family protein
MPTVRIPASLRSYTQNLEEVQSPGSTVGEVIQNLESKYPGLRDRILDGEGALRRYVNLFHNQEDIRFLQQLGTVVQDGDRISVVPAIAGG